MNKNLKKVICYLLGFSLFFTVAVSAVVLKDPEGVQAASGTVYTVNTSSLTVRSGAGSRYKKLGTLSRNTSITVYSVSSNNWGKISYKGKTGWVALSYCKKKTTASAKSGTTSSSAASILSTYKVTSKYVTLRKGAGSSYKKLGTIYKGTSISVSTVKGKWGKTSYKGKTGWVYLPYCKKITSGSTSAQSSSGQSSSTQTSSSSSQTSASSTQTSSSSGLQALHVSGTKLVNSEGAAVQLKGFSTHGIAWFPQYINQALFTELHNNWNANVIRLSMYTAESGGYCTGGNQSSLKQLIDNGVKYAANAGMYVIIDWHILSDGNPNTYKKQAVEFFTEMAKKYASYNNVIYEICNEPNGGTSWSQIKSYAADVIKAIRTYDDAVIIVGTPNWSQYVDQAASSPITGYSDIMYSLHFYAGTHKDSLRNTLVSAIKSGLPVFVTEYGTCDASGNGGLNTAEADKWVSLMDQYGVSYCNWSLCNKAESASLISSSCSKTSGLTTGDLSASGKWVYQMMTGKSASSGSTSVSTGTTSVSTGTTSGSTAASTTANVLTNSSCTVTMTPGNSWTSNGYTYVQYACEIKNNTKTAGTSWKISYNFSNNIELESGWNANYTVSGKTLTLTSMDYNGAVSGGGTVSGIGFIIKYKQ